MSGLTQPAEFFLVGGPVQPGRACCVERVADRALVEAAAAGRLCCVLGPRAVGKSSLLLRAARTLRAAGTLVAAVDLRKPAEQGSLELARRIAAALELGIDIEAWWNARAARGRDNKLVDFFWEIVLTNTTAKVAVLVDDVESMLSSPFGGELRAAVSSCYGRRGVEPDFARLNFVLAGNTSLRQLAGDGPDAVFAAAEVVEPEDFSAQDVYRFAPAFGGEPALAHALLDRICVWTSGHPYLTQKVARGVARKGGRLEDVERVVREQLLTPGMADGDPLLLHTRTWLMDPSRPARRARKLLQRLATGGTVAQPADVVVWEWLWLSGTVRLEAERKLRVRNRVVKELVAARWLKVASGGRRFAAVAAVLAALLAIGGYWYTQYLPTADIATLGDAGASLSAHEEAYRRLRALPGFAERADGLWLDALARQSATAPTLAAATAVDARLRELPGQAEPADRLLAEFWLRRARVAVHAEQRDAALLMAQRAASLPAAGPQAAAYLAELVGDDYRHLDRSLRLARAPAYWQMRFASSTLLSLDAERQMLSTPFGAAAGSGAPSAVPVKLSALQHAALVRELAVAGEGTAGELELTLAVQHPAGDELLVTLRAPSGAEATVNIPRNDGVTETFVFPTERGSPLAQLADEGLQGVWRLTIVDRAAGNTGTLAGWGLRFGIDVASDDPPEPLAIPDPVRVEAVAVLAVGERAAAWPTTSGVVGSVALWNLATGQLEHDFTLRAAPRQVAIDASGERLLAATDDTLWLWNAADGALVARIATQTEFVLPPVFSADGAFLAIAERVDGAGPLYSVLRSSDASLVTSIEGGADAQSWELGRGARYIALLGPPTVVRVLDTRRGTELARLPHALPVLRLLHALDGAALLTIDEAGALAAWTLAAPGVPRSLGRVAAAASVSLAANGTRLAYTRDDGGVTVLDVATGAEVVRLREPRALPPTATQLSTDGTELVTQSGASLRRWRLPPAAATASATRAEVVPTAVALDRGLGIVAVGFASGQVDVGPVGEFTSSRLPLAFFGHRGPVSAVAVDAGRGLVATGGADGIVRLWDSASGAPTGVVMQSASAPIGAIALGADGSLVANAAGRVVRVANVADGRVTTELETAGVVTVVGFASDGTLAVGAADGAVTIAGAGGRARSSAQLGAAVSALAFRPDGAQLAAGDGAGGVQLIRADGTTIGEKRTWPHTSVRWLDFSPDGRVLFVATDEWLHALDATAATLEPLASRLLPTTSMAERWVAVSPTAVQRAAFDFGGVLAFTSVELAAQSSAAPDAALVARDWPAALALRLDDNGEPVPYDP